MSDLDASIAPAAPRAAPILGFGRIVAVLLLFATLLTGAANLHWIPEIFANLRVQLFLGLLFPLAIFLLYRRWGWCLMMIACLSLHVFWFRAALPQNPPHPRRGEPIKVMLINVLSSNHRHREIAAEISSADPDVFAILELSSPLAAHLNTAFQQTYPHAVVRPMDRGNFGIGVYSRHPFVQQEVFISEAQVESIACCLDIDHQTYQIIATHPLPPIGAENSRLRNEQLQQLATKVREAAAVSPGNHIILIGDLNLTPWSPYFASFEQRSGLRRANNRFNLTPTWYRYPLFPFGLVLDHAMIAPSLTCIDHQVGRDLGSDHRPVTVTLIPSGP